MNNPSLENNFNPPWETKQVLLTFLIAFLSFSLFGLLLGLYLRYLTALNLIEKLNRSFFINSVWGDLLMLFYLLLLGLAAYLFILKKIKGPRIKFFVDFSRIKKDLRYAFITYLLSFLAALMVGMLIVAAIIFVAVLLHKDPLKAIQIYSEGLNIEQAQITAHLGLVKIALLIFVAPIIEEVLFRGCLYGALRKRHSAFYSILLSSFIFAALHGYLFNFLNIFFMGIIAGWIYEKRKSLTAPVFFHFLWNVGVLFIVYK